MIKPRLKNIHNSILQPVPHLTNPASKLELPLRPNDTSSWTVQNCAPPSTISNHLKKSIRVQILKTPQNLEDLDQVSPQESCPFVKIDSSPSPSTTILIGVPQGSVLGPLLFVLFISPIANVINSDQSSQNSIVSFHQHADHTQLYIGTNSSTLNSQITSIKSCSQRVHDWLLNNGLHLNQVRGHRFSQPQIQTSCCFSWVDWNDLSCRLSHQATIVN